MSSLELVDDDKLLRDHLKKLDLIKEEIKNIVSAVTPYLPYVGLICGGVCVARYIWKKKTQEPEDTKRNNDDCEECPE